MTYKISYSKIAIEIATLNILALLFFSVKSISGQLVYLIAVGANILIFIFFLMRMNVYKLEITSDSLKLFKFKFASKPQEQVIPLNDVSITYFSELSGKGIRQKKIRIFKKGNLEALIEPSLTGWHHNTIDQIVSDLKSKSISIQTE